MPKEKKPKEKKVRPPKEKKPKKVRVPKAKKPKNVKGAKDQKGEKKKKNPILLLLPVVVIAVAAVAVLFFLKGRGDGDTGDTSQEPTVDFREKLPQEYVLDGNTVPGLMPADGEEGVRVRQAKTITYTYDLLKNPGSVASDYTKQLTSAGFSVVDEGFVKTDDRPDYTAPEGSLLLAKTKVKVEKEETKKDKETEKDEDKEGEQEEEDTPKVVTVVLSWAEDACVVVIDEAEGTITSPPKKTPEGPVNNMTISEAEDYLLKLAPQDLGLDGDSMEAYNIYAMAGTVFVNGQPCIRLTVYSDDNPQQANAIAGSYLLTSDGLHLYQLDESTKTVRELKK